MLRLPPEWGEGGRRLLCCSNLCSLFLWNPSFKLEEFNGAWIRDKVCGQVALWKKILNFPKNPRVDVPWR